MADRERSSERARQLLGYLRDQSGAEPPQASQYIGSYASSKLADGSFVPSSAALNPVLTIGANAPHHLEHRSATGLMARNPARLGRVRRFAAR
jgi:hypothetical protein